MDVVDPAIKDGATQLQLDTMKALGFLALGCLEERRQNRPSMKEVAEEIEYIINIEAAGHPIEQQRTCLDSSE
nr:unknown [Zea mays]